jgi:hypothetical protein
MRVRVTEQEGSKEILKLMLKQNYEEMYHMLHVEIPDHLRVEAPWTAELIVKSLVNRHDNSIPAVGGCMGVLIESGMVVCSVGVMGPDTYGLTETGRAEAERLKELEDKMGGPMVEEH